MALTIELAPDATDAAALAEGIAAAERRLHAALLAGARTADLHREIVDLRAAAARGAAQAADDKARAEAKAAQAHQERIATAAARYADDIAGRLAERLAALAPPPFSTPTPTRIPSR